MVGASGILMGHAHPPEARAVRCPGRRRPPLPGPVSASRCAVGPRVANRCGIRKARAATAAPSEALKHLRCSWGSAVSREPRLRYLHDHNQFSIHPDGLSIRHRAARHSEPGFRRAKLTTTQIRRHLRQCPRRPRFLREACSCRVGSA